MQKVDSIWQRYLNRRQMLKNVSGLIGLGGLYTATNGMISPLFAAAGAEKPLTRKRLGIIGGGMGGLATAWLCDDAWDVELFEARDRIGGHCDTRDVEYQGHTIAVDLGAQFFHPDTHPYYLSLLEELGLFQEDARDQDQVLEAPGSLSIYQLPKQDPYFISSQPFANLRLSLDFAIYTQAARAMITRNGSYETTLEDWIAQLPVSKDFKYRLLLPWMSALIGTTIDNARRTSARSLLQSFALSFPANILKGASTWNSKIGLQGNLQAMIDQCQNLRVSLSSPVSRIEKREGAWYVSTPSGEQGPFDQLVINAQPQYSKNWVATLPWAKDLAAILGRYEYFDARIVIHSDPCYLLKDRKQWSVYNAGIDDDSCEGSVWLGGIHEKIDGAPIDLFKSWAYHRDRDPDHIIHERSFRHPLITPDVIRAARELAHWQGVEGLWFAGQHTTGMDLQDGALFSATEVARHLSPRSPQLKALRDRLAAKGLAKVSYRV